MKIGLLVLLTGLLLAGCGEQDRSEEAGKIAEGWAETKIDEVAGLVTEAVMESSLVKDNVPSVLAGTLQGTVKGAVTDQLGRQLTISLDETVHQTGDLYRATLLVAGSVEVGIGPVEGVDASVPILLTVNVDSGQVESSRVDLLQAKVTVK